MVAVIEVLFTTLTPVAAVPPRLTVAPARKPVPVMVTAVPPFAVPLFGVIEVTVGAGLATCIGVAIGQRAGSGIRVCYHNVNRARRVRWRGRRDRSAVYHTSRPVAAVPPKRHRGAGQESGAGDRNGSSAVRSSAGGAIDDTIGAGLPVP